ncbi:hypothetical protein [Pseudomonas granadensis]|uniref:hypothetical protein n=1 Tax=Pseudomonas granadensis TaxID=1421430 RepID=UPI00087B0A81|nr:hypothetical protein [Pseudomonas granadensis]SDT42493.1 hypothetical protein SAMN05216579_3727 [Pseudomonas granadensis]
MRLSDFTKFPHPVLSPFTGDFLSGEFSVDFDVSENLKTGALFLRHNIVLTHPDVAYLVASGQAVVGCLVKCSDTYYNELRLLSYPEGSVDFVSGSLLNKVSLRPIVWLSTELQRWSPEALHSEFSGAVFMELGDIIAIGAESEISVGQAKLASIESIFELNNSSEVEEGEIRVDLEGDRISILVSPTVFSVIELLRQREMAVVLNSVYLPAVMEVLDRLQADHSYDEWRWFVPFMEKCRAKGIAHESGVSILEGAQKLLELPALKLDEVIKG